MNKTSKTTMLGYGAFNFGANCVGGILASFLTIYLTDNLLLSAAFIAGLMLVGRIANALMEFLMGIIIDKTSTKYGKARPWIILSTLPTVLPVFLLFNTPSGMSVLGRQIWVVVCYLCHIAIFGSATCVAFSALLVKITDNPNTRVKLSNLSNLMGQIGALLTSSYGVPLLMYFGGYETGYRGMSLVFCVVGFIGMLLTGILCKENPEQIAAAMASKRDALQQRKQAMSWKQVSLIFKNKYALPLLVMFILYNFAIMIINSITVYYARDVMGNAAYMKEISYAKIIPVIIIGLLGIVPTLSKKFGKKTSLTAGAAALTLGFVIMAFAPRELSVIMAGNICFGIGIAFYGALMVAVTADCADLINLQNKIDVTGTVTGLSYVGKRLGMALGSIGVSVLLSLGNYDAAKANAGLAQSAKMLMMEKVGYLYIPMICFALLIFTSRVFRVDKEILELKEQN